MANLPSHHTLIERSDWTQVLRARREGVAWEQLRSSTGVPALGQALLEQRTDIVERLLALGAPTIPTLLRNDTVFSPLWVAARQRQTDALRLLLAAGAQPEEPNPEYRAHAPDPDVCQFPLTETARQGWSEGSIILLQAGATPNPPERPSPLWRWLMVALDAQNATQSECARTAIDALIDAGADLREGSMADLDGGWRIIHRLVERNAALWQPVSTKLEYQLTQKDAARWTHSLPTPASPACAGRDRRL